MNEEKSPDKKPQDTVLKTAIDLMVKIGLLLLVIFFCFKILQPFVHILLWAMIIAIILFPLYEKLGSYFGNRKKLASVIIIILVLAVLLIPSYWLVSSLVDGLRELGESLREGSFQIPPPKKEIAEWPLIGNWLYTTWLAASENLGEIVVKYLPQLKALGEKLMETFAGTGAGILQFACLSLLPAFF